MKRLIYGAVALTALSTQAMDVTPYLLINKEYRHLSQEDSTGNATGSSTGITDVDGFETRLGVKGSKKLENKMTATAKVELGINSKRDNHNNYEGERIRIRLAQAGLSGNFGSVTIGKHWNPNTLRMLKLDPFTATGAQLLGLESGDITGAVGGNFGMRARYFNDGITYKTPDMNGFALSVTADQSDDNLVKDNDGKTSKFTTAVATYDKKFGKHTLNTHVTYAMGDIEGNTTNINRDETFLTLGAKLSCNNGGISLAYTKEDKGQVLVSSVAKDVERKHMMAAVWYNMNKLTLGFNYGKTEFGDNENIGSSTDNKGGEQSQMAAGAIYKLAKNVKTRLIYRVQNVETKGTGTVAGTSKENESKAIITGLTVNF